ncbi:MAG: Trk system potassium transporter TrkA [Bacteroidales bacterium]|nr:Trk system potassium transporter TrkA [Bacteroidales bacterium]
MRIVIAGDGEVGLYLAQELTREDHNITIIVPTEDLVQTIESHTDVLATIGDSTLISVLKRADVKKADLLISCLHQERINILTALLGKKLGADKTIARVNTLEYLSDDNRKMFEDIGIDHLVCPEEIAALEIIDLLRQTAATETFDFSEGKLSLFLFRLEKNAPALNKTLDQIAKEFVHLHFRAVAIHRNRHTIIPKGSDMFFENDLAYVITKPQGISDLLKLGGKTRFNIRNLMLLGGGRVGKTVARRLEHDLNIKIIEKDKKRAIQLANLFDNCLVIHGDARDIQLLEDEDIAGMDAFVALTNNSETNILACLHAKTYSVPRTIALVENIDYIDISQNIGIGTIVCKKLSTASHIIRFTMNSEVTSIKCLSGINAQALELVAKPHSPITKSAIRKLNFPRSAIIGGIIRGNDSFIAVGDFQIEAGDRVVVFALPDAVRAVDDLFH